MRFPSSLHSERIVAILGMALGIAFLTCFATGLLPAASALVIVALGCLLTVQAAPGLL